MTIREITKDDYEVLIALFVEFSFFEKCPKKMRNSVTRMYEDSEYIHGFVAEVSGEIVGYTTHFFAYYTWYGKSMYLDDLYVTPDYRGKGIGSSLINAVIDKAKEEQCRKVRWQVSQWNGAAIEFYKSLGAVIESSESNCDLLL